MCGRFTRMYTWRDLVELYHLTMAAPTDWGHAPCSAFDAHSKLVTSRDPLAIPPAGGLLSRGVE
jgi:hypothetical protein